MQFKMPFRKFILSFLIVAAVSLQLSEAIASPCGVTLGAWRRDPQLRSQVLLQVLNQYLSHSADWNQLSKSNPEADKFLYVAAFELARLKPKKLPGEASVVERSFAWYMQEFSGLYGDHWVAEHVVTFVLDRQVALVEHDDVSGVVKAFAPTNMGIFSDMNAEVPKYYEIPESEEKSGPTKARRDREHKTLRDPSYNIMSWHMTHLRRRLISGLNDSSFIRPSVFEEREQQEDAEAEGEGNVARSRAFGPNGLEIIPDDQIRPLRREDQAVMGRRRPPSDRSEP